MPGELSVADTMRDRDSGKIVGFQMGGEQCRIGGTVLAATSRALTEDDDGITIECTATISLTLSPSLPAGFGCAVIPSGTTSIVSAGGVLLNGATATLTRAAAGNAMIAIVARKSALNSYIVSGT